MNVINNYNNKNNMDTSSNNIVIGYFVVLPIRRTSDVFYI